MSDEDFKKVAESMYDYAEQYAGSQLGVLLMPFGTYSIFVSFPDNIQIFGDCINPKGNDDENEWHVAENTWFTSTYCRILKTKGVDIFKIGDTDYLLKFNIGIDTSPNARHLTIAREPEMSAAKEKYKNLFEDDPKMLQQFEIFRARNMELESRMLAEDYEWIRKNVPKQVKEIVFFDEKDAIELGRKLIDAVNEHYAFKKSHSKILNKIKQNYESRRFKRYEQSK